jgi:hypothetical protein
MADRSGKFKLRTMDKAELAFWMTGVGTLCWIVCFWWMHRISSRQDALLKQLHDQSRRIERLSKAEHDLIKEVHPQVNEIKEGVNEVAEAVKQGNGRARSKRA